MPTLRFSIDISTKPTPFTAPGDWYLGPWGTMSRDRRRMWEEVKIARTVDKLDAYSTPMYYGPSFDDVVAFLPHCRGFEDTFTYTDEGERVENFDELLMYVVEGDPKVYTSSDKAEEAWKKLGDEYAAIMAFTHEDSAEKEALRGVEAAAAKKQPLDDFQFYLNLLCSLLASR